ncbi:MAG: PaaI family thioesterase [Deltaproteobacteria bacterium]|nr:PaaI family thioesterase [Deltaproteobacteria bacterium]
MNIETHKKIDNRLVGTPVLIEKGTRSEVILETIDEMSADEHGLVHGGFIYGLADYATMLAVNHPNVVLGASQCKFIAPVRVGDTLKAIASIIEIDGRKHIASVEVHTNDEKIFEGRFKCYVLDKHVLIN